MINRTRIFLLLDPENNYYLKFNILGKRTIKSILFHYQQSGIFVDEIRKLDTLNDYYFLKKTAKRNSKFLIDPSLLKNESINIRSSIIKQTIAHFDSVFFKKIGDEQNATVFIKMGKRISNIGKEYFPLSRSPEESDRLVFLCFQNFKVINSLSEYLPLVYYSNSVRYRETLKKTAAKIENFVSNNKKVLKDDVDISNKVEFFKKEFDGLDKKYKSFIKNKDNIPYSECIQFNEQCLRLQNIGEHLAITLSYYMDDKDKEDDNYAIQTSRNDCVFYRGLTDFKYDCYPKIYRNEKLVAIEDTTYREYRMRFPDIFEGKTPIESITLMQHFGCPTRLLDITTNPLVALFMACYGGFSSIDESKSFGEILIFFPRFNNGDNEIKYYDSSRVALLSCLTRLDIKEKNCLRRFLRRPYSSNKSIKEFLGLNEENDGVAKMLKYGSLYSNEIVGNAQKALKHLISIVKREQNIDCDNILLTDLMKSYYVKTSFNNDRIRAQSGCFILCGLNYNYADKNFSTSRNDPEFYRIIIKDKANLLSELQQLNIHQASMMPDMENVADFLTKNKF